MMFVGKAFLFLIMTTLILSAIGIFVWCICLLALALLEIVVTFIYCLYLAFCGAMSKIIGDPKDGLIETDSMWLAVISPFHKLSKWRRNISRIQEKTLVVLMAMIELTLFPLSLIGGAILITPGMFYDAFM